MRSSVPFRIAVDTGGTFTDFAVWRDGKLQAWKVPSTPSDPALAVAAGREQAGSAIDEMIHGTTVGTNALLERRGGRTAFVTTAGFRDLLALARQDRPRLYELEPQCPDRLVPEQLCFEVEERTRADGAVESPPDPVALERLLEELRAAQVESIAIVLLHSYANPANEEAVVASLRPLGLPISASHQVLREYREYERAVATVLNAYLTPVMETYLSRLEGKVRVMRSNGGALSGSTAAQRPLETILSGPAGGVVGAAWLGEQAEEQRIITFDMGGTSTDVSLLDGGPRLTSEGRFDQWPLKVPMIDIHTVGAGGGSVAWRDGGGALRVGPRSVGADPGPACYGRGSEPTVTDANLHLGRIQPAGLLGGAMPLRPERGREAVTRLARDLGLTPEQAAEGVLRVAEASMERAIRLISLERGEDPSRYMLYSFGGAGGLHVVALARSLGIPRIRIPAHPGVFSAVGMLASNVVLHRSETVLVPLDPRDRNPLDQRLGAMQGELQEALRREGFPDADMVFARSADLRYRGQSFELNVSCDGPMEDRFHSRHEALRGHSDTTRPVEVVNLRVEAIGRITHPEPPQKPAGPPDASGARVSVSRVWLDGGGWAEVPVYARDRLNPGMSLDGPAIVEEYSATHWIPTGARCAVDGLESLLLEVQF